MSLYTTLQKTKQEMPDRLKRLQQEAEATRKMAAAQSAQTPTAGANPSPTSGTPQMEQGRSTPSAAELAGSVRSSLVSPTQRAETISQLAKKLQEQAEAAKTQEKKARETPKSTREYLGLPTSKSSGPVGAPSVRELLEQGMQDRAEQIKQYEEEEPQDRPVGETIFNVIGRGAGQFNSGVASTVDFLANLLPRAEGALFDADPEGTLTGRMLKPITDATGALKDYTKNATAAIDQRVQEATKDSKASQVAANIGSGVISAVPNAALALMTAGGSAAGQLAPQAAGLADTARTAVTTMLQNPMYWTSAAQTLGTSYDEAVADGATETEAILAATLSTAFNAAVEVGGGVETLPSEIRNVDMSTAQKALEWLKSALEEGGEEFVQGILERLTNKAVFDEEKPYFSMTDENAVFNPYVSAQEAGMGTAVGGILGGGQVLADTVLNRSAKWNADRLDAAIQG